MVQATSAVPLIARKKCVQLIGVLKVMSYLALTREHTIMINPQNNYPRGVVSIPYQCGVLLSQRFL